MELRIYIKTVFFTGNESYPQIVGYGGPCVSFLCTFFFLKMHIHIFVCYIYLRERESGSFLPYPFPAMAATARSLELHSSLPRGCQIPESSSTIFVGTITGK